MPDSQKIRLVGTWEFAANRKALRDQPENARGQSLYESGQLVNAFATLDARRAKTGQNVGLASDINPARADVLASRPDQACAWKRSETIFLAAKHDNVNL